MKQTVITTTAAALHAVTKAIGGAAEHGAAIGLKQHDAMTLTAKKDGLIAAEASLDAARAELKVRQTLLVSLRQSAIALLTLARDLMKPRLGSQYSALWLMLGYAGSIMVPRNLEGVKFKLQKLAAFLAANPDAESIEKNITAVHVQALLDDLIAKENAVTAQRTVVADQVKARKAALKTVTSGISGLVAELKGLLKPLDARYLSFGLNKPGAMAIPSAPPNLVAVLVGPSAAALRWNRAERAERYRLYKKVVGVDTDMVLVETREDLDFVMEDLPSAATIQTAVAAVNDGGESALSEIVTITTPS